MRPAKEFGENFYEYYHKGKDAIKKLLQEAESAKANGNAESFKAQVAGAFYRKELGDIDLVWGDSSFGLKHIIERRSEDFIKQGLSEAEANKKALEFVESIPQIVEKGKIKKGQNRIFIDTADSRVLLALDYKGDKRKWIITAYRFIDDLNPAEPHQVKHNINTSSVSRANVVK